MPNDPEPDYVILPDGRLVFTATYLRRRGFCCGNGCRNCPYEYEQVREPKRTQLLLQQKARNAAKEP